MAENIIVADKINRIFELSGGNSIHVLKDVTVNIPKSALTILKGPSGSGKTTLMNILGALDAPTSGSLTF
ncbi:MAG: ATP-binding cassette domain-containing protein, partial [Lachnospiraceae bacterium]|nr:ATP-binding cassette domain-containing protein [Lachnospiraceae bacterium]